MASACTAGQSGRFTAMHSACVTRAAAIASSSAGSSAGELGEIEMAMGVDEHR